MRPPEIVMRLDRMGAAHPTRLSFMRQLVRRLHRSRVKVAREVWELSPEGYGRVVYTLEMNGFRYSFCAFSSPLEDSRRTDRVIAEAWDATFVLCDGTVDGEDLERLEANVARQEAGRFRPTELVISRANKSMRMFEHVVNRLADGRQPDPAMTRRVGYLMRTTAVYGNGKFGLADRDRIADRLALAAPFQAELLTVWLIRGYSHDLVEHVAAARNPGGWQKLTVAGRRSLGIGNATGLGMAPFLVTHPTLIDNWMTAREAALAMVRSLAVPDDQAVDRFLALIHRAREHVAELEVGDRQQADRNRLLESELRELAGGGIPDALGSEFPWDAVIRRAGEYSLECQELMVSAVIEPHGDRVDRLGETMSSDREFALDPAMSLGELGDVLDRNCRWAEAYDFDEPKSDRRFWYVSEEKLEPRLGDRYQEPGSERELPLDIARQFQHLRRAVGQSDPGCLVAELLLARPELRTAACRAQNAEHSPYAEVRDNLLGEAMRPIDLLRSKLAFFGATKFDPKSDLWTRITMYQGAPLFDTVGDDSADDWAFPVLGAG